MSAVAAVLDTSAVLAYAGGQVAVGELISMVEEEGRLCAVPASCLAAVRAAVADDFAVKQLGRLTGIASVAILPLMSDEALEVGSHGRRANSGADTGHAVHLALRHRAYYATADAKAAAHFLPESWEIFDVTA